MSVHQTKTGAWFVIYRPAPRAKQKKEWFGRGELNRIKALKRDEEIKILTGRSKEEATTFKELASLYHLQHSRQDSTTHNDHYKFKIILPLIGNHVAENLSPRILDDYVKSRIDSVKRSTISREVRLIKAVMSWAEQQDPPLRRPNPHLILFIIHPQIKQHQATSILPTRGRSVLYLPGPGWGADPAQERNDNPL